MKSAISCALCGKYPDQHCYACDGPFEAECEEEILLIEEETYENAVTREEPHCGYHQGFQYDCMECIEAIPLAS